MDRDMVSSYSGYSNAGSPPPTTTLNRYRYSSDPTLLNTDRDEGQRQKRCTSVQDDYPHSEESVNLAKQAKKSKKKKLKRLRSFVHVFLGGLRRRRTVHEKDEIAVTRFRQKDERDGAAVAGVRRASTTSEPQNEPSRGAILPRIPNGDIPGLCGLYNHGNTCFMNAVLQCLSNTDQLAGFFVTDQYKTELNGRKPLQKKFGTAGDITEHLAFLFKCLWGGQYDPRVTARFKDVVGAHATQYQGSSQHDAQEFFLWLLDNVHEDLNQAARKKYRPIKDTTGRPEEEVAAETLASHMKSNNSFIQNLFQGQFRSALLCPSCGNRSCTFDPYVCVSLPLPQRETRPVYITMIYRSTNRQNKVFGINISIDGSIRDLRNSLAELCGVHRHHLVLCDLMPDGFHRTFYDDQHISVVHAHDLIFAFECPPYRGDNPEAQSTVNPSGSKELILVLVVNKFGQTQYGKRFGPPLILRIWRDLTHFQFQSVILKAMTKYLREGVKLGDLCRSGVLFRCRVMDGLPGRCVLPTDADHPFYSPTVDKAQHVSMLYGGPAHIKVVTEWEPETKASVFGVVPDDVPEPHESATELRQYYQAPLEATLHDCLQIYTQEETVFLSLQLNREDQWFCPHCKQQQQNATKKINLWTLPDVLVLHLKRFRQLGYCRTKLGTLVKFPTSGLDMTPYLAHRSSTRPVSAQDFRDRIHVSRNVHTMPLKSVHFKDESQPTKKTKSKLGRTMSAGFHFPWKKKSTKQDERSRSPEPAKVVFSPAITDSPVSIRSAPSTVGQPTNPSKRSQSPSEYHRSTTSLEESRLDNVYDLYAVCNHLGSMSRGHYTACCKNPADGNWYMFDDIHVQPVTEEELITQGAYMLFYVRQSLMAQSPLSSSESSTSSASSTNHWIYHMPPFTFNHSGFEEGGGDTRGEQKPQPRSRLGSANSAVSAPPTAGLRVSPPSSAHDNDSDVFAASATTTLSSHGAPFGRQPSHDARSAVSLPPYNSGSNTRFQPPSMPQSHNSPIYDQLASPKHNRVTRERHYTPPKYDQTVLASPIQNRATNGRHPNPPKYDQAVLASPTHSRYHHSTPKYDQAVLASPTHSRYHHSPPKYDHEILASPTHTRRHPSMRLGKVRHTSQTDEQPLRRGRSFHSPRHHTVHRSDTLPGRYAPDTQPVMPSRSIPNVNISPLPQRAHIEDTSLNFMTPQLRQRSSSYSSSKSHAVSQRLIAPTSRSNHPESCV